MISGSAATEQKARTGLLTPPTRTFSARANSSRERLCSRLSFCLGAVIAFEFLGFRTFLDLDITCFRWIYCSEGASARGIFWLWTICVLRAGKTHRTTL